MDFPIIVYEEYSNDCSDSDNVKRVLEQINMQLMNQCCDNNTIAIFLFLGFFRNLAIFIYYVDYII